MADYRAAKSALALEALSLSDGTTTTTMCPVCNGGRTGERKLSLTRTYNGAMYCCHRASCGFRGFVSMDGSGGIKDTPRQRKSRPFSGIAREFQISQFWPFEYKGLAPCLLGDLNKWGLRLCEDGLLFECRGFNGELLGHVTRSRDKIIRTYRARDGVDMYAVYLPDGSQDHDTLVIVEDCISAMCCASHGYTGLALLGTHLSAAVERAIQGARFPRIVCYLDEDAARKSIDIAYRFGCRAAAVIGEGVDPKDNPRLAEVLG